MLRGPAKVSQFISACICEALMINYRRVQSIGFNLEIGNKPQSGRSRHLKYY